MENNDKTLTWDEFIDFQVKYCKPKGTREQTEGLWQEYFRLFPGEWKFKIRGEQPPAEDPEIQSITDYENFTIILFWVTETMDVRKGAV